MSCINALCSCDQVKRDNSCFWIFIIIINFFLIKCKTSRYYIPTANDCVPKGVFGNHCTANNQCLSTLGCDIQPSGSQTLKCLYLSGAQCLNYADCANNLDCVNGRCACTVTFIYFSIKFYF